MVRGMAPLLLIAVALVAMASALPANLEEDGLFKLNPEAYNILSGGDPSMGLEECPENPGSGKGKGGKRPGSGGPKMKYVLNNVGRCCKSRLHLAPKEHQRWYIVVQKINNIEVPIQKQKNGYLAIYDWSHLSDQYIKEEIKLETEENLDSAIMPVFITKSESNVIQVKICGHSDDEKADVEYGVTMFDPHESAGSS